MSAASGYLHPGYAQSLAEFGSPLELRRSGGVLLTRSIAGSSWIDAMGTYPYLACTDWSALAADLGELAGELVSVCAAPEPFGRFRPGDLERAFPDRVVHFKDHYVADLSIPADRFVSNGHRRRAEKSLRTVSVEVCTTPSRYLEEWTALFGEPRRRFGLTGIRAFSRDSFAKQFVLPDVTMTLAREAGDLVAAHVQVLQGDVVYAHLAAATPRARAIGADFALYLEEIRYFAGKARWIDWGGNAGTGSSGGQLASFKSGWSSGTRPAYFAGRISDPRRYRALATTSRQAAGDYFPAYRSGEFG